MRYSPTQSGIIIVLAYTRKVANSLFCFLKRERCLDLADRAGLNVNAITKRVVELLTSSSTSTSASTSEVGLSVQGMTTLEDDAAIRAIEWLTFDPDQLIDALINANALARKFIGLAFLVKSKFHKITN